MPRVFVSSVMEGFRECREAARRGILAADCQPVLAEDFPSLPVSPRTACLDAVQSSDVYVGILGHRAGSEAPSGMTIVEEEFEEARARRLSILIFLEEGEREPRQQEFVARASEFVEGAFRTTFERPEELEAEVERALRMLEPTVNNDPDRAARWVSTRLGDASPHQIGNPKLQIAIAPIRQEEVIDPRDMETMAGRILDIGHSEDVALMSYETGYESEVHADSLRITPTSVGGRGRAGSRAVVELHEDGRMFVEANATEVRERDQGLLGLQVVEEDVRSQLMRAFSLVAVLYDSIDEYRRHQGFLYQAALCQLGSARMVPASELQSGSVGMPMGSDQDVFAHPEPRTINRRDLTDPTDEVDRTITRFRRTMDR